MTNTFRSPPIPASSGLGLVALVGLSLVRDLRRAGPLSSCAVAAVVCWAVGGAFDFSWHLPVLGLLGGWCAGLADGEVIR